MRTRVMYGAKNITKNIWFLRTRQSNTPQTPATYVVFHRNRCDACYRSICFFTIYNIHHTNKFTYLCVLGHTDADDPNDSNDPNDPNEPIPSNYPYIVLFLCYWICFISILYIYYMYFFVNASKSYVDRLVSWFQGAFRFVRKASTRNKERPLSESGPGVCGLSLHWRDRVLPVPPHGQARPWPRSGRGRCKQHRVDTRALHAKHVARDAMGAWFN
jgi:hypothetical protein